jgi:hypothetical protein
VKDFELRICDWRSKKTVREQACERLGNFMKIYSIIFIISVFIFTSCSSTQMTNVNTTNTTNSANSTNTAINTTAQNQPQALQPSASSPMETMKALNEAAKVKNPEAIKKVISKGTLALMEQTAKTQETTVDELLKKDDGAPFEELPEMRNEKIEGDKATVEVKNKMSGEWSTLPFVKEEGVWKVAIDKYLEDVRKQMTEQMNEPPTKEANTNKAAKK